MNNLCPLFYPFYWWDFYGAFITFFVFFKFSFPTFQLLFSSEFWFLYKIPVLCHVSTYIFINCLLVFFEIHSTVYGSSLISLNVFVTTLWVSFLSFHIIYSHYKWDIIVELEISRGFILPCFFILFVVLCRNLSIWS